jgi:hypothetical protein
MENINFSLIELKEETFNDDSHYDIEHWKLYYSTNYTIKGLQQILQYYGLPKNKMVKEELIQVLLFYETDLGNKLQVERRMRLWQNIQELKADAYFSKYILF